LNKFISERIDGYSIRQLHKRKSAFSHFKLENLNPITIDAFPSYFNTPQIPQIKFLQKKLKPNYSIGKFTYNSQIKNNNKSNDSVFGYYHINLTNKDSTNVILVHGWRMDNYKYMDSIYLKSFMNLGYNIYHFVMPYHFERNSNNSLYNGELLVTSNIDRTLLSIKQAVSDLRALIRWLKANTQGEVILIGVSLGGFLTNLTSAIESGVDMLISVFYANSLAHSVWNTKPGKYIKNDLIANSFSYNQLKDYWAAITPSLYQPAIPKSKILLLSAAYDQYVDLLDSDELWLRWGNPERILYKCGHSGIVLMRNQIKLDSLNFIKSRL